LIETARKQFGLREWVCLASNFLKVHVLLWFDRGQEVGMMEERWENVTAFISS